MSKYVLINIMNKTLKGKEQLMELLEEILNNQNLNSAYKRVKKNGGAPGIDGVTIEQLAEFIQTNGEHLMNKIRKRKYKPAPVRRVEIPKPNGGIRKLGIPTTFDRVLQQAISQKIMPIFEEQFSENSYGFRPKRSAHDAINKSVEYIDEGYHYIIDIDMEKFFDNVCHTRLMTTLYKSINDNDVMSLIGKYLRSGVMENGVLNKTIVGTPQGGPLSPLLANIVLNELDWEITRRGLRFVRYADDILIFVKTERSANRVMERITKFIETKLRLKVNKEKSKVLYYTDIKYLGFGFYDDRGSTRIKSTSNIENKTHNKNKEID